MTVNILERNLDAVERVIGLTKKGEVCSSGSISGRELTLDNVLDGADRNALSLTSANSTCCSFLFTHLDALGS